MDVDIAFTELSGDEAGEEIFQELGKRDLIFLFPATLNNSVESLEATAKVLKKESGAQVVGSSVGGFATPDTDGLNTRGIAAAGFRDIEFETARIENAWNLDPEDIELLKRDAGTTYTFESGARGAKNSMMWDKAQGLVKRLVEGKSRGTETILLRQINYMLKHHRMGFPEFFIERINEGIKHGNIVNFNSGDQGDFLEGYEIFNGEVTESQSATLVYTEQDFKQGVFKTTEDTLESDRVLESFDEITGEGRLLYRFNGHSLSELEEEYPVQERIGRGGFVYYLILETSDSKYSIATSSDLGLVVNYFDVERIEKAHLVRAPGFQEYMSTYREKVRELEGLNHISLTPPQMDFFEGNINQVVEATQEELDEFLLTVDNGVRDYKYPDYTFPGYVQYQD
ncbi:MAG: hypothetical protein ABEJ75_02065 [Candidatus Nanohaloarchaea archaeon]